MMPLLLAQAQGPQVDAGAGVSVLAVFLSATITENILLTRFLGMCPFLSISRQLRSAFGMGLAVVFVTACTVWINWLLYEYVMAPLGKAYGIPVESLKLIVFIVVIAAFVQLMEMLIERLSLGLYFALGIFLPLITVNCAILGGSLFMVTKVNTPSLGFGAWKVFVYGLGAGLGWMMAIVLMAGIRERLAGSKVPAGLQGPGITLIIAGIMALAFIGFSGVIKM